MIVEDGVIISMLFDDTNGTESTIFKHFGSLPATGSGCDARISSPLCAKFRHPTYMATLSLPSKMRTSGSSHLNGYVILVESDLAP